MPTVCIGFVQLLSGVFFITVIPHYLISRAYWLYN